MSIVGLDLAGVETRPTGFCLLLDMKAETCLVYKDKEIIDKIFAIHPKIVAIDAPLCLPPGRKSIENELTFILEKAIGPSQNGHKTFSYYSGSNEKINRTWNMLEKCS